MGLFSWFRRNRKQQFLVTTEAPARSYRWIGGRRIINETAYALPNDITENERLNLQHYVMRYAMRGNYAVPFWRLGYRPKDILDVACGSGRWGAEMAYEFPDANVVGIDIAAPDPTSPSVTLGRSTPPENYLLLQGDVRKGLPFPDNAFDYVHMRFLVVAIGADDWPQLVQELVRVTRPDGWIELVDTVMRDAVGSPAHQRFFELFQKMTASRNYDLAAGEHIEGRLRAAGLAHVQSFRLDVPIGDWGGRIGSLMRLDVESAVAGIVAPLTQYKLATAEEAQAIVKGMSDAMKTTKGSVQPFYIAIGQKATLRR
jgi:ubiquinone/menaquinone biosynthesis C-methylase UbiE